MNKSFFKAAAALVCGLFAAGAAMAELPTDATQKYKVKNVDAAKWLNIETAGQNAKISDVASIVYFKKNDEGKYAISNGSDATGNFVGASGWNAAVSTDASYIWTLTEQAETSTDGNPVVTFSQTISDYTGDMGIDALTEGVSIFCNKGASNHNKWELVPVNVEIRTVSYKFTYGTDEATITAQISDDEDASRSIPTLPFFTATGLQETNTTVSADNVSFTVEGTWSLPFVFGQVYRMDLRQSNASNCNNWKVESNQVNTRQGANANEFEPERLFYLKAAGLDAKGVKATLHAIAVDEAKGFQVTNSNNAKGSFTDSPTVFNIVTNSTGTNGFSLAHSSTNNSAHVNDISGLLGIWSNGSYSQNDGGSYVRCKALTDDDFTNTTWHYFGVEQTFDTEALNTAKAAQTAENLRALFTPNDYRAAAEARYRELTGFDYDADYKCLVPGWKPYTEFDALANVLKNSEATQDQIKSALDAQTSALSYDPNAAGTYAGNITPRAIYTIRSTEYSSRGALKVVDGVLTATANDAAFDASDEAYQFMFVEKYSKYYLYSIGGQEFLYAFGEKTDNQAGNAEAPTQLYTDHTWTLDSHASAIELGGYAAATPHSIFVKGGVQPSNPQSHMTNYGGKGGLTIMGAGERKIIVAVGITNAGDGNGLFFNYAGQYTGEMPVPAHEEVSDLVALIPVDEDANEVVNHLPYSALTAINAAVDPSHQWHLLNNTERTAINTSKVYTLKTAGGKAIGVIDGKQQEADYVEGNAAFNWSVRQAASAEPETAQADGDTAYEFVHKYNDSEILLTIDGATQHTPDFETVGQVGLGGQQFVMTSSTGNAETTSIAEIGTVAPANAVYDLQGRRVAAPVKGINIIGGQKVLVK